MSIYVGGYPANYNRQAGITSGFHGAIQRFYESGALVDMSQSTTHAVSSYNGPPCLVHRNPCLNNSRCVANLADFECRCPPNFTGKRCDIALSNVDTSRPLAFDGKLYYRYRNAISRLEKSQEWNWMELRVRSDGDCGLLVLQHSASTTDDDVLAIAVRDGRVEVVLNLGKNRPQHQLVIRSSVVVSDRRWHTITFARDGRIAELSVDSASPVTVLSSPGATHLDTDGYLWLGGSPTVPSGLPGAAYYERFVGCVAYLRLATAAGDAARQRVHLVADRDVHDTLAFCDDHV